MLQNLAALGLILDSPATAKGRAAHDAGAGTEANPFEQSTRLHTEWLFGWKDARRHAANRLEDPARPARKAG
ncbi:hypothetical protein GQ651_13135 [Alphaproteobacteria bacterium GH1-50]|uniref:Uncharacterized protein n=1 Tax=Kangsaoukella pontilimi TaxID=2691042 RepID=A0A7C9MKX1_9RHOB|nr:hypothetical protein [Kangsaoukella pontilimi]MXQ08795.1 hypothetical protein [Kangsaoukella pontilimi]